MSDGANIQIEKEKKKREKRVKRTGCYGLQPVSDLNKGTIFSVTGIGSVNHVAVLAVM